MHFVSLVVQWKAEFAFCQELLSCAPYPVLYDPDNEFEARMALRFTRHAVTTGLSPRSIERTIIPYRADPKEPELLLEWQLCWPNRLHVSATCPRRMASGHWKAFVRFWCQLLHEYEAVWGTDRSLDPVSHKVAVSRSGLRCELSEEARSACLEQCTVLP
jgi:hypothetical protein